MDQQSGKCPVSFPVPRPGPFAMPSVYGEMREAGGVSRVTLFDGRTAWLVTGYEVNRQLAGDPRLSSNRNVPGFPAQTRYFGQPVADDEVVFLNLDNPDHDRIRRMFNREFTVRAVAARLPGIEAHINGLIDEMLRMGPPVDAIKHLALPVPVHMICEILGVPVSEREFFERVSLVMMSRAASQDEAEDATRSLTEFLLSLAHEKEKHPGTDLISRLVADYVVPGALTWKQLVNSCALLLSAGHDTTASSIGLSILALLQYPDQARLVREGDERVLQNTVEELVRFLGVVWSGRRRVATADIEVGGCQIRAGDGVILGQDSANRDPSVFVGPDALDVRRHNARAHIGFGFGVHQCLGQNLARLEIGACIRLLLARLPAIRLACAIEDLSFVHDSIAYGVRELPLAW